MEGGRKNVDEEREGESVSELVVTAGWSRRLSEERGSLMVVEYYGSLDQFHTSNKQLLCRVPPAKFGCW